MINDLMKYSKGNPGALTCLMGLIDGNIEDSVAGIVILPTVERLEIFGTDLYVLWSDICAKDYQLMAYLCENVSGEVLKDASSRQDYSGVTLVQEYINKFVKKSSLTKS